MQASCGVRCLALKHARAIRSHRLHSFIPFRPARRKPCSTFKQRTPFISASSETSQEGTMAPGGVIYFPKPLLVAALAFGMSQLYTLALNDALLPETLRSIYYNVLQSNANARNLAVWVTAVHVIEAAVALWTCVKKGFSPGAVPRFAVVGGGFAGVAAAWHLLALSKGPVAVDLFDVASLAGGASGAAAGLLHPYSPRGKLLWRGQEAIEAALELLDVASQHHSRDAERSRRSPAGELPSSSEPVSWAQPFLRPAANPNQARGFARLRSAAAQTPPSSAPNDSGPSAAESVGDREDAAARQMAIRAIGVEEAVAAVPGLPEEAVAAAAGPDHADSAALLIEGAHVIHPERYLRALWGACSEHAHSHGASARVIKERITSLGELERDHGPYAAVVVAAGAAAGLLPEIGDRLPMELCQGYTLDLLAPGERSSTESARSIPEAGGVFAGPSLLGTHYLAAQGRSHLVVGATKRYGLTAREAFDECGRHIGCDSDEAEAACQQLLPSAHRVWPPAVRWKVGGVRSGVRALPPRTAEGSLPLAGKLQEPGRQWWVVVGLGARGLVYHAWLGRLIACAILANDEEMIPLELRRWQHPG